MRVDRSGVLFLLLFAVTLAAACGSGGVRGGAPPFNSQGAGGNAAGNRAGGGSSDYSDPDGAFAIKIPDGWRVEREEKDGAYMTVIRPERHGAANLSIMTIKTAPAGAAPAGLRSHMLLEGSKPFFQGWLNGLREQARVEGTGEIKPTRLDKFDAVFMEVTYYRGDADDPREGYCVFLSGEKTTFFISLTGSRPRFEELKEIISTLRIEA